MIVDTSALIAILLAEPDAEVFARALVSADGCRISAANYVEVAIVVEAQTRDSGSRELDRFFQQSGIVVEPVTEAHAHLARHAYTQFGKGRHRAGLNFGDCFAYALAKAAGEPLLYKGDDFRKTDIRSAL